MAISGIDYKLFRDLRLLNALPLNSDVLELGEANWYGDVDLQVLRKDMVRFASEDHEDLSRQLDEVISARRRTQMWEIARIFWRVFIRPRTMTAIDFHGTELALKLDLNSPINLQRRFGIVMNLGTVEHVFNVAQALKTMHDHTLPGGLIIHGLPFTGWVDHGFYSFNPTFYWDLAARNGYRALAMVYAEPRPLKLIQLHNREQIHKMASNGEIGKNTMIYAILVRPQEELPFQIPIQGFYAGAISGDARKAWRDLR